MIRQLSYILFAVTVVCVVSGCGERALPALVAVKGTLLLDGKPLPHAEIRFQPSQSGLPTDSGALGVTDNDGKFTLETAGKPGAIAGEHIVSIAEGPAPAEARGDSAEAQMAATNLQNSLGNRPIPKIFATSATSPTRVTVKADQQDYEIRITRE